MRKEETVKKHLDALRILKEVVKYNPKISMTEFMKDHNLSKNAAHALTTGKIIINTGGRGKGRHYVWNTINPNRMMAEEWLIRMQQNANKARDKKSICFTDKDFDDLITVEEKIIELRKKGLSYRQIADELNVKNWKVHKVCTEQVQKNDLITKSNKIKPTSRKKIKTKEVRTREYPIVDSKQKSIVILWGLINIKF